MLCICNFTWLAYLVAWEINPWPCRMANLSWLLSLRSCQSPDLAYLGNLYPRMAVSVSIPICSQTRVLNSGNGIELRTEIVLWVMLPIGTLAFSGISTGIHSWLLLFVDGLHRARQCRQPLAWVGWGEESRRFLFGIVGMNQKLKDTTMYFIIVLVCTR